MIIFKKICKITTGINELSSLFYAIENAFHLIQYNDFMSK